MAEVSQSKVIPIYVRKFSGFSTSTIVTKTGGVNSDGSSSFTRQIVRYNDKNIVPSNPNETYVDSNTGLSKRRYRIGDTRTGQDPLVLYDYGDGTGTPTGIGVVIAVGNNLNGGTSLEFTAKSTADERRSSASVVESSRKAIDSVKKDFNNESGELSVADQKGLQSLKKKNGFDKDPVIGTSTPLDESTPAPGQENASIKSIRGTRSNFKSTTGSFQYPRDIANDQDIIKFNMLEYSPRKLDGIGFGTRRDIKAENILGTVILPVSSRISDTNSCDWGENKMNALGIIAGQAALGFVESGFEGLGNSLEKIAGDIGKNKDASKQFAVKSFLSAAVGQDGQGLFTRQTGAIVNPNIELLFNSPQLREFSFDFTLAPRDKGEAEVVIKIIRFFKQGMAPIRDTSRLFLKSPHTFEVEFLKRVVDNRGVVVPETNPFIGKKKECALVNVSVDYTPNGTYSTYDDGVMTAYKMTLTFKELEAVYNDDYEEGSSAKSGLPAEIGF
tara:strand:- start:614 stop:2113 length:1500 start_codon:yes stop_codon:yes gene_type:complete